MSQESRKPPIALLPALALIASCHGVSPPATTTLSVIARVMTRDFHTHFELDDPELTTVPEITAPHFIVQQEGAPSSLSDAMAMTDAARRGISLVDLASRRRVPGQVVSGFADWRGVHSAEAEARGAAYSFVPAAELADGWYVLRVDLAGWHPIVSDLQLSVASLHTVERTDRAYVRVHVGSAPVWWATNISCTADHAQPLVNTQCQLSVLASERVADWGTTTLEVRIDGVMAECPLVASATAIGCRLTPFQQGASLDVHFTSAAIATPEGSHDETRHIVFQQDTSGVQLVEVSPDFGIATADGAR